MARASSAMWRRSASVTQTGVSGKSVTPLERLRAEGTSHRQLLDQLRRDLATRYLAERELDILEIAFALGFSDQAAFHHAFVRWTGQAPGAFRRDPAR